MKTKLSTPRNLNPVGKARRTPRAAPIAVRSPKTETENVAVAEKAERAPRRVLAAEVPDASYSHDAYNLYMREVGETKLLTRIEENDLAKRIRKGDKAAREQMIKANLRLVVKIARDYENYGVPLLDLINEGNIGLMKGVERFNPRKGAKLSTYAAWWIKQAIKRALANQSKTIRLPVHVVDKLLHIRRAEAKLQDILGREPSDEEVGAEVDLDAKRVSQYRKASVRPQSLDAPISEGEEAKVADVVPDANAGTPYQELEGKTNVDMIHDLLPSLDQREQAILRQRFGLDGGDEKTLEELGEEFGVTRERIRQIQEMAMAKLRRKIEKLETVVVE
jgi:RNA polymerase primary sigma factor